MDKSKVFKVLIVIVCLFFTYEYFVDNKKIAETIYNISYSNIILLISLSVMMVFLYAYLMLNILRKIYNINIPTYKWLLIYFNSQFLNSIPLLGIFYRANQLKKFNLNYDKFFGIYIMINWFWLFLSLLLFGIEALFILKDTYYFNINISNILISLSFIFFLIPLIAAKLSKLMMKNIFFKDKYFFLRLKKLIDLFFEALQNRKLLKNFIFIFITIHIVEFFIIINIVKAINDLVTLDQSYLLFMGNTLIDTINIIPQNLVISEIGMGILTDKMNYDFEFGIIIKLYLRFIVFFSSVFLAILYNIIYLLFIKKKVIDV